MMGRRSNRTGFSLIEVNLAILIVAVGMLTLFSLFPSGLRQVESAHTNTQEAMFAESIFSSLRSEVMSLTVAQWDGQGVEQTWTSLRQTFNRIRSDGPIVTVRFPESENEELYIRYILEIARSGQLRTVSLWCRAGEYGAMDEEIFKRGAAKYYTDLFYSGMP